MAAYFVFHRYALAEIQRLRKAGVPDLVLRSATTTERRQTGANWVVEQVGEVEVEG